MMIKTFKHNSRLAIYAILSLTVVLSSFEYASAYYINNEYIENGVTQFDERVTGPQDTCAELPQTTGGGNIGSVNLGDEPKERRVNLIKLFMSTFDISPEQAAGMIGNFAVESGSYRSDSTPGIRPDINQGDSGAATGSPPDGSDLGYGWPQWSNHLPGIGRKTNIRNFLKENPQWTNDGRATDMANVQFLKKELETSYKGTLPDLRKADNPTEAMYSFERTYERAGTKAYTTRAKWAEQSYREYVAAGGGSGPAVDLDNPSGSTAACESDTSEGGVGTAQSAQFSQVAFPLKGNKSVVNNPGMFHDGTTDLGGHNYIAYDILTDSGTEVVAFAAGEVTGESVDRCGGKFLTIWNEQAQLGVTYMHLSNHIRKGTKVQPGDHVGTIGSAAAGCGTEHLHIDVATDKVRQGCSRLGCSIQDHFRSIGKDLFNTYQALPE